MAAAEQSTSLELRTAQVVANLENPAFLEQIEALLPDTVPLRRFVQVAKSAILSRPELVEADETTLFSAILRCAQDGLFADGREAVINVYRSKVKVNGTETSIQKAEYLPMIAGVRKRFAEHGWQLRTEVICEHDEFEDRSSEGYVVHRKPRPGVDRGQIEGAFAMAVHRDGRREAVVMTKAEIDEVRDKASKNNRAWVEWYSRMAEKTPAHRLEKKVGLAEADRQPPAPILAELATENAAELLYGHARELPAVPPADADEPVSAERESQQAEAAASPDAAAASVPGDEQIEDGVFEPIDDEPGVSAEELAAAETIKVTSGVWKDKTLGEIAEAGVEGSEWLLAQLRKATEGSAKWAPLATVIQARLPETWAAYEQWRAEQS